jgi:hypothetical protein
VLVGNAIDIEHGGLADPSAGPNFNNAAAHDR